MENEAWETVACSPNYEVSSLGRVRRLTAGPGTYAGKILSQPLSKNGYPQVNIRRDGAIKSTKVHTLVATAFHGERPTVFHEVAHRDGDRTNNRSENLRWATGIDNAADNIANGTHGIGERHAGAKLTDSDVKKIRAEHAKLLRGFATKYGIDISTVRTIISGSRWSHVR
jgi:hypothetical protein